MEYCQTQLESGRSFWNANPCDGQTDVFSRMRFRYDKEPWLPPVLDQIAKHSSVLEVGCGQGTDALYCCQQMRAGARYIALDWSDCSVQSARKGASELGERLKIRSEFLVGNAESLEYTDGSFDCVVSLGALHHTPRTEKAVDELYRVLRPGGTAYVTLYRRNAPKVLTARAIRVVARCVDRFAGQDGYLCSLCRLPGPRRFLGTMLLECLGVPILRSFTSSQVRRMFSRFNSARISATGMGIPSFGIARGSHSGAHILGTQWLIVAVKAKHEAADRGRNNNDDI